ncbi:MAG: trypsin-like peptidase domain-containing protein, partial [Gammaproteobacteria bacterium]|nr:trypsin-like peptidase domain-containing protein [Gammaproteobacteria bacterium]
MRFISHGKHCVVRMLLSMLLASLASSATAEVYKYKDANGNWQFSDKPPTRGTSEKLDRYANVKSAPATDYRRILKDKFQPESVIEAATIAVVKVETPLGSGSGFFLTRSGYLVTNKHVVRPPELSEADREGKFLKSEAALQRARKNLGQQRLRLQRAKRNLDEYTDYFRNLGDGEQRELRGDFEQRKKNYAANKRDIRKYAARIKSDTKKMNDARNNYNRRHSNTMIAQQFTVRLKDDTPLNAALVSISKKYDLALLKVEGHSLPFLPVARDYRARQGHEVFAIGSPLGNTDYVTSGIITSL